MLATASRNTVRWDLRGTGAGDKRRRLRALATLVRGQGREAARLLHGVAVQFLLVEDSSLKQGRCRV